MLEFVAYGDPAPQGSKKFVGMRDGHAVMVESSKYVKPWRKAVKAAAVYAWGIGIPAMDGPIRARMVFTLEKPKSAPKRQRTWPMRYPDVSKLARSTEDALVDAKVIVDDSRIVGYTRLEKVFPGEDPEALDKPGVRITLELIDDENLTQELALQEPEGKPF